MSDRFHDFEIPPNDTRFSGTKPGVTVPMLIVGTDDDDVISGHVFLPDRIVSGVVFNPNAPVEDAPFVPAPDNSAQIAEMQAQITALQNQISAQNTTVTQPVQQETPVTDGPVRDSETQSTSQEGNG